MQALTLHEVLQCLDFQGVCGGVRPRVAADHSAAGLCAAEQGGAVGEVVVDDLHALACGV